MAKPKHPYSDADFSSASSVCDIIMKGGITSGVVYPLAICELAKKYRFGNIGGTSAGAIAAAAGAAAEYGRCVPGKGFMRLAALPHESGRILLSLFQPSPALAPLFQILVAATGRSGLAMKIPRILGAALMGFWWRVLLLAAAGVALAYAVGRFADAAAITLAVVLGVAGAIGGLIWGLLRLLLTDLPANRFGLCPGIRQPGNRGPGFTDWLADLIDDAAGRDPSRDAPLTFGDLAKPGGGRAPVNLLMMTTNLMQKRPHTLPFHDRAFIFKKADFEEIFPQRIVAYLIANCERYKPLAGEAGEFFYFPTPARLPLVVAARMSLSFPILICAVPLYARDFTLKGKENEPLRKCLFSDGGLSSNFPIHFFDRMLPGTPTFGILLDRYDQRRDRSPDPRKESRVWMPDTAGSGQLLPIESLGGLVGFLGRLVDAAKDWQDTLQETLSGYRDRIVHVYLKPDEGGLNLAMPADLVEQLADYGHEAGTVIAKAFDFDEHRWRRFLVAVERLDQTVVEFGRAYEGVAPPTGEPFKQFLERYPKLARSYEKALQDLPNLKQRAAELNALATAWSHMPPLKSDDLPHPKTDLRIRPKP